MWLALAALTLETVLYLSQRRRRSVYHMKLSLMMSTKEITTMKRLDFAQVVPDAASAMMALEKYVRSSGLEPA